MHRTIRKVTEDIEALRYNTAIAAVMEYLNVLQAGPQHHRQAATVLLQLIGPFAPFVSQELWEHLGEPGMLCDARWPQHDPDITRETTVEIAVQVNGRVRQTLRVPAGASQDQAEAAARQDPRVQEWLRGATVTRVIFVPDKLVNFVCRTRE